MRTKFQNFRIFVIGLAFLSFLTGTAIAHEKTVIGSTRSVGNGTIRSWAKLDHGKLVAIGVTFDEGVLQGLPAEPPPGEHSLEYSLTLPSEASDSVFKHIGFNWNPHGHEPSNIYDVGHFDFHFYLISEKERMAITAAGDDLKKAYTPMPKEFQPEGYVLGPDSAFPRMGAHWADPNSHEFHGHPFTKTFIYGNYDGKLIFFEPMVTLDYLRTKPNVVEALKLPSKFAVPGYYPSSYSITYNAETREYTVALEGMTQR